MGNCSFHPFILELTILLPFFTGSNMGVFFYGRLEARESIFYWAPFEYFFFRLEMFASASSYSWVALMVYRVCSYDAISLSF